jgi:hypothetical protein
MNGDLSVSETDATNQAAVQTLLSRAWVRLEGVIERLQDFVAKMNTPPPAEPGTHVAREPSTGTDRSVRASERANMNIARQHVTVPPQTLAVVFATVALVVAFMSILLVFKYEREYRLLQKDIEDQNAILLREGLRQPGDASRGASGNLQYQPKEH